MLDDAYEYRVPVASSREDPDLPTYSETAVLAWESKNSLRYRLDRLGSEYAWSERPAAFARHFVSNVRVWRGDTAHEWVVASNILVTRNREPEPPVIISAGRTDLIRGTPTDGFRIVNRLVELDVEVPTAAQLSVLL